MDKQLFSVTQTLAASTAAPDWLHLVPAGSFSGVDGRGPFELDDAEAVIAASLPAGRKLPIDENHAIDILGPTGGSTHARAWIVELQSRDDGIWGRVEWTGEGRRLIEDRAYGFLSPALMASKSKPHKISQLLRASLTNDPNLTNLKSLHQAERSDMEDELRTALGLPATADKAAILVAVAAAKTASTEQAALMSRIAEAAGAKKDATADELIVTLQARGKPDTTVAALNEQITALNTRLTETTTTAAKDKAEAVIGKAIAEGKLVPAMKDHMIARHMKDPADVEKEIAAMVSLHTGSLRNHKPSTESGAAGLSPEDAEVCELMGLDPVEFAKTAKMQRVA